MPRSAQRTPPYADDGRTPHVAQAVTAHSPPGLLTLRTAPGDLVREREALQEADGLGRLGLVEGVGVAVLETLVDSRGMFTMFTPPLEMRNCVDQGKMGEGMGSGGGGGCRDQ